MFCCSKQNKVSPRDKVSPRNNQKKDNSYVIDDTLTSLEFTEQFVGEVLSCGTCSKAFSLRDNQIAAYCGGCYKFMHCGIAGSCVGPNCTYRIKNEIYRQSWCKDCVPKTVIINLDNIGEGKDCLCQECLDDPETPNAYKRKI